MKLIIKISCIVFVLLALALYNYFYHSPEYFKKIRAENRSWNISHLTVKSIDKESFYADNKTDTIIALDYYKSLENSDTLAIGDLISIKSIHISGDTVVPSLIHIHKGRNWKIYLSIIPVFVIFFFFIRYFKFDKSSKRIIAK